MALRSVETLQDVSYQVSYDYVLAKPEAEAAEVPLVYLPHYIRPRELPIDREPPSPVISSQDADRAIAYSDLTEGSQILFTEFAHQGGVAEFPGGGLGIDFTFLKEGINPAVIEQHAREIGEYLRFKAIDIIMVPRNSGVFIGGMYAAQSGLPVLFWDKEKIEGTKKTTAPIGSFVSPTYTGSGDVIIQPPMRSLHREVDRTLRRQLASQQDEKTVWLHLRAALADDMFDSGVTNEGMGLGTLRALHYASRDFLRRYRDATGDDRRIIATQEIGAMVTPFMKVYKWPYERMDRTFGPENRPVAAVPITGIYPEYNAIGVEGVGVVQLRT